jgi:hypothetical protein
MGTPTNLARHRRGLVLDRHHATAPYLNGPGLPIAGVKALRDVEDARRMVDRAGEGATSFLRTCRSCAPSWAG